MFIARVFTFVLLCLSMHFMRGVEFQKYLLEDLHVTTFSPLQVHTSNETNFPFAQRGIKKIVDAIRNKETINTHVLVRNSKLCKDALVHVHSGMPVTQDSQTIFIYSPGWLVGPRGKTVRSDGFNKDITVDLSGGVGAYLVYRYMRFGILSGTTVTFDYPTDALAHINGGQTPDVEILRRVYDAVVSYNPKARIVLVGDCKGGTTILNLISHPEYGKGLEQICAVLVESPPLSLTHIGDTIAAQWLWWLPYSKELLQKFFGWAAPAVQEFDKEHSIIKAPHAHVPQNIPIFLGCITPDDIASATDIRNIAQHIQMAGNSHVFLFSTPAWVQDATGKKFKLMHARLGKLPAYQEAANAFFARYGFPHDAVLAARGIHLI